MTKVSTQLATHEPAGKIELYTIENINGTRLVVSNIGAAVVSLFVRDKKKNLVDVVLGYDHVADYEKDDFYIGTVVGRYANRIAGDAVQIEGTTYRITTKPGGYHHHGGALGFNKKIFSATSFHNNSSNGIVFSYTSPHLEEGFPGELKLDVIYTLDNDDRWTIEYKAISSEHTLINLTQHTYFNLSGQPGTKVDKHLIKINSDQYLPVNKMQVPIGDLATVNNTPFDFSSFKEIGRDINVENEQLTLSHGYDHSFVLEKEHSVGIKHAAIVCEPYSKIRMEVYTTEPAVHFYTGNFLENVQGKNGIVYGKRAGFCLETQHFPDAPNQKHFPSTLLKKGQEYYSCTSYIFSISE